MRQCLADMSSIMRVAFYVSTSLPERKPIGASMFNETFEDRPQVWIGYPYTAETVLDRPNLLFRHRHELISIFREVHELLFGSVDQSNKEMWAFASAVYDMAQRLRRWYARLPLEIQYAWPMSIAVFELQ
jgi:hypothetical protein